MAMMVFNPKPTGSRVLPETRLLFLLVCQENGCLADITYKQLYFPRKAKVQWFSPRPPEIPHQTKPSATAKPGFAGSHFGSYFGEFCLFRYF